MIYVGQHRNSIYGCYSKTELKVADGHVQDISGNSLFDFVLFSVSCDVAHHLTDVHFKEHWNRQVCLWLVMPIGIVVVAASAAAAVSKVP